MWAIAEHLFAYRFSLCGLFHSFSLNNTHAHKSCFAACPMAISSKRNNLLILRLSWTCLILYKSFAYPMLILCNSSFSCLMEDKLWISKPPLPPTPLPPLHDTSYLRTPPPKKNEKQTLPCKGNIGIILMFALFGGSSANSSSSWNPDMSSVLEAHARTGLRPDGNPKTPKWYWWGLGFKVRA